MLYCTVYQKLACAFGGKSVLGLTSQKNAKYGILGIGYFACVFLLLGNALKYLNFQEWQMLMLQ